MLDKVLLIGRDIEPKRRNQNIYSILIASLSAISLFYIFILSFGADYIINAQNENQNHRILVPSLTDPKLEVELVARTLHFPTSMDFLAKDDIMLLEKNTGDVYRIVNGKLMGPLLHLDVADKDERGLLGIAVLKSDSSNKDNTFVFLYYTQCVKDDQGKETSDCRNYVYRYKFEPENNKFVDPKLILTLPGSPGRSQWWCT